MQARRLRIVMADHLGKRWRSVVIASGRGK
jgi:hypothetical protein